MLIENDFYVHKKAQEEKTKKESALDKIKKNYQVSNGSGSKNNLVMSNLSNGIINLFYSQLAFKSKKCFIFLPFKLLRNFKN